MAATGYIYGNILKAAFGKQIDFLNDDIKVALCTSSYVPNQDTHLYYSHLTNEVTGTGYTAGGVALTSKTLNFDTGNNRVVADAADVVISSSSIVGIRYAVFYDNTPETNKPLISYIDLGDDYTTSSGTFTLNLPALGILCLSTAAPT